MRSFHFWAVFSISSTAMAAPGIFEVYPVVNGSTPVPYTKTAPTPGTTGLPWASSGGAEVKVLVDATQVLHPVTPYQFGCNAAWWDSKDWFRDPDRVEKARQAGIRFWRWPGGSSSDNYHWDGNYGNHPKDHEGNNTASMNQPWAVSTDDFIEFCRKTGSEAILTVNYGAARYAGVKEAAGLAASWVRHCNIEKKFKVRYWEIGNEVYGPWEEGNKTAGSPQLTGDAYGRDFQVIAQAMKKVDPDIDVGAVVVDGDGGDDWTGYHWWMRDLLPQLQGKADYLILHQYYVWPFNGSTYLNPSNDSLFGNLHKLEDGIGAVGRMENNYVPNEKSLPVVLTEYNLMNASPPQTIELINGLFTAEVLGESIKAGYAASNYWDWKNGLDGKLGGDMAMLSSNDPSVPDATPRPSYYAFALYARAFGDRMVAADSPEPALKVYASLFAGGELGLVIVNENGGKRTMDLDLKGFVPKGKLVGWVLTGKGLNEKRVRWNGVWGPPGGGGPFPLDTIPPYEAAFKKDRPLRLGVEPRSVTGLILY